MLFACWSPKGGTGTTVVSAALALILARDCGAAVVADLTGDVPTVLGITGVAGPGLSEWLAAGATVPVDGLRRIETEVGRGLSLLALGTAAAGVDERGRGGEALAAALAGDARPVVVDCGHADRGVAYTVAASATRSLLVMRPCYLALQRAAAAPLRPSGVVLIEEPFRSLTRHDVAEALDVPLVAVVAFDATIHRAADAGLLRARVPRLLEKGLRPVLAEAVAA